MTQLDEKALEAAWDKYLLGDFVDLTQKDLETIVRAYLDALPPMKRRWIIVPDSNDENYLETDCWLFDSLAEAREDCTERERIVTLEIREVRPSPPSVEG